MLRFLVALALVVGTVQCVIACTPIPCCPHHKQVPANCTQELIPAPLVQPLSIQLSFAAEPVAVSLIDGIFASLDVPLVHDPSPPGSTAPIPLVLKI